LARFFGLTRCFSGLARFFSGSVRFFRFQAYKIEQTGWFLKKILIGSFTVRFFQLFFSSDFLNLINFSIFLLTSISLGRTRTKEEANKETKLRRVMVIVLKLGQPRAGVGMS